ncbi:MAG: RNA polymerase sigma factor [Bryobacterales bacterium]|nr:RNA polymerase sigma factor [Bryobacterales bacterium]
MLAQPSEPVKRTWDPAPATAAAPARTRPWEAELPPLMVRYQNGDPDAVDELVRTCSPVLLPFLGAFGLSRADTEDLFQECWIRVHKARHTYRAPEPVLPWIFAIARHTRLDGYRRRRKRENREVLVASPPERSAPVQESAGADLTAVQRMLESLPEAQREVIFMLKVAGMSLEEVARATSSTVGAIKQKAHRAYEKLRLVLEGERK